MKIAGAVTVFVCCYYAGYLIARNEKKAFLQLSSLIRLFDYMLQRVSFSRENLGSIFGGFEDRELKECGFLDAVTRPMGDSFSGAWERAVGVLGVEDGIAKELLLFGASLGKVDFDTQRERMERCRAFLASAKADIEPGLTKRLKAIRTMGGLIGALSAIILM